MKRLVILVLILVAGVGGYVAYRNYHAAPTDRILVSGNIELEEVNIAFKTAGRLVERDVTEGDTVTKGEIVARLDKDQLIQQRAREVAALNEAESNLAASETALTEQQQTSVADLQGRQADLDTTKARLASLKAGSRPQEIAEANAAIASAQAEYDRAQKDWVRAQTLHKSDDISTSQYEQARSRFEGAEATLKQAQERANLVTEGSRKEDVDQAQAQVAKAVAGVKAGEAQQLDVKRRQEDVSGHEAEIAREKAQIALIDSQLNDTTVTSPINGVVLVKSADVGEILAPGTSILTIGDIDHPWLRAYINEKDLGRVKLGSKVNVTTDAYPGKVYNGRISFINSEAEFTPKQIQTTEERVKLVYRIKIDVDNPQHELKSNMPADAVILVNQ